MSETAWRPISEAPKDGTRVLLYDPTSSGLIYTGCWEAKFYSHFNEDKGEVEYSGDWTAHQVESWGMEEYASLTPTHFMPLPQPPQQ